MRQVRRFDSGGFTLVELLVVIGIIALLIGILLPALSRAKAQAQGAACAANARQIALAELLYANDNGGVIVPYAIQYGWTKQTFKLSNGTTYSGAVSVAWNYSCDLNYKNYSFKGGFLSPYLQSPNVLLCPGVNFETQIFPGTVDYVPTAYGVANCGGYVARGPSMLWFGPKKLSQIRDASSTVIFGDAIDWLGPSSGMPSGTLTWPTQLQTPSSAAAQHQSDFQGRHPGSRGTVSFFDGHAELIPVGMRPKGSYLFTDPGQYEAEQKFHLGECIPPSMKITEQNFNAYQINAPDKYDYYFWPDKGKKGLSMLPAF